jgi:hypothetical protein
MVEINSVLLPNLKSLDTLFTFHVFQNIQIPIFNTSMEDIMLPTNSQIANICIFDDITDIYHLNILLDARQSIDINSTQTIIKEDEGFYETEREQALMEYLQSGKYTKSMSQLISDSPSVTEMKLQ